MNASTIDQAYPSLVAASGAGLGHWPDSPTFLLRRYSSPPLSEPWPCDFVRRQPQRQAWRMVSSWPLPIPSQFRAPFAVVFARCLLVVAESRNRPELAVQGTYDVSDE